MGGKREQGRRRGDTREAREEEGNAEGMQTDPIPAAGDAAHPLPSLANVLLLGVHDD